MRERLLAYIEISKVKIGILVMVTTAFGYFMAGSGIASWPILGVTLIGTFLSCGGAAALNCFLERDIDCTMERTRRRPLPTGVLSPVEVLTYGILAVLVGVSLLAWKVNLLTGFLALLTAFLYALVYTPLKRITWMNTLVGAIPGAIPPMGGWAAATGGLEAGAWILFLILFIWQHPHFFAIAWMYRDDYRKAGFKMLPAVEEDGKLTMRLIIAFSVLLIPASLLPTVFGSAGWIYAVGAQMLGMAMLVVGVALAQSKDNQDARALLRMSLVYLPGLFVLLVTDVSFLGV